MEYNTLVDFYELYDVVDPSSHVLLESICTQAKPDVLTEADLSAVKAKLGEIAMKVKASIGSDAAKLNAMLKTAVQSYMSKGGNKEGAVQLAKAGVGAGATGTIAALAALIVAGGVMMTQPAQAEEIVVNTLKQIDIQLNKPAEYDGKKPADQNIQTNNPADVQLNTPVDQNIQTNKLKDVQQRKLDPSFKM